MIRVKFDLRKASQNYSDALALMAKLSGLDRRAIGRAEAGVILKTAAARTRVAPVSALTKAGRVRALRGAGLSTGKTDRGIKVSVNAGVRGPYGRVWARKGGGDSKWLLVYAEGFRRVNRHFDDAVWAVATAAQREAKEKVKKGVKRAKETGGLARKGWIQIADSLGIDLATVQGGDALSAAAIMRARAAKARGGRDRENGTSREVIETQKWFAWLIYSVPYGRKIGLDRTLTLIIANRTKFFAMAVQKGYNGALEDTAKLLPGWTVKGGQ